MTSLQLNRLFLPNYLNINRRQRPSLFMGGNLGDSLLSSLHHFLSNQHMICLIMLFLIIRSRSRSCSLTPKYHMRGKHIQFYYFVDLGMRFDCDGGRFGSLSTLENEFNGTPLCDYQIGMQRDQINQPTDRYTGQHNNHKSYDETSRGVIMTQA